MPENSLKNKTDYKRLGDYIREVDSRNRDLTVTKLMGINIGKFFMPSVANVIGTDLSNYKVVFRNCFACNLMHVGRDEKIPIALHDTDEKIIISPAYFVFEISKPEELLPAYLMMWFRRREFDRNAWFYTDSDVRGGMSRDAFCDLKLPIPPLSRQREIVAEYETLTLRIRLNERLISSLESAAQTLYRRTFVDNIDPARLPPGWRTGTLSEIASVTSGKTLTDKRDVADCIYKYPIAGAAGIIGYAKEENQRSRLLTTGRVGTIGIVNKYDEPCWTADNVLVVKSDFYEYVYQYLKGFKYEEIMKGGVQSLITQSSLNGAEILIPDIPILEAFEKKAQSVSRLVKLKKQEISNLTNLLSLLLARMGNEKMCY